MENSKFVLVGTLNYEVEKQQSPNETATDISQVQQTLQHLYPELREVLLGNGTRSFEFQGSQEAVFEAAKSIAFIVDVKTRKRLCNFRVFELGKPFDERVQTDHETLVPAKDLLNEEELATAS